MSIVSGLMVYIMLWWLVIFAVLPWGVQRQPDGAVGDAGAPREHNMKKKVIATTCIAAVLWLGVYFAVSSEVLSFRDMAAAIQVEE